MEAFNEQDTRTVETMNIGDSGLHGDVIVTKLYKLPDGLESIKDPILAHGEATGHAHKLFGDFQVFQNPETKQKYFRVGNVCYLKHQEHARVEIPAGDYVITQQREYDHFSKLIRVVAD